MPEPIFFARARSFWFAFLSVVASVMALLGQLTPEQVVPMLALLFGESAAIKIMTFSPLAAVVFTALVPYERRGNNRPYTRKLSGATWK